MTMSFFDDEDEDLDDEEEDLIEERRARFRPRWCFRRRW